MDQGAHNTGGGGGVKEIIARVFTVKYAPCTTFLSFFDPPAGNPQRKEMDCTGRRRDRSLLFFFPSMEGGLARRIFLVRQQHYCQAGRWVIQHSFTGSLTLTFSDHVFFRTNGTFHLPLDVPYPIIM